MPIISLTMYTGKTPEEKKALCTSIQTTMKDTFAITHNNFHFCINEYNKANLLLPESISDNYLSIEIQLINARSISEKESLYKNMAEALSKHGIETKDILIIVTFPPAENWFIRGMTGIEINKPKT